VTDEGHWGYMQVLWLVRRCRQIALPFAWFKAMLGPDAVKWARPGEDAVGLGENILCVRVKSIPGLKCHDGVRAFRGVRLFYGHRLPARCVSVILGLCPSLACDGRQ